jgi:hypothetical protein
VSHQDQVVALPPAASVIAQSDFTPYAGLDYRNFPAISFQCHPEFEPDFTAALYIARRGASLTEAEADAAVASLAGDCDRRLLAGWIASFLRAVWADTRRLVRDFKPDVVIASSSYPLDIWVARRLAQLEWDIRLPSTLLSIDVRRMALPPPFLADRHRRSPLPFSQWSRTQCGIRASTQWLGAPGGKNHAGVSAGF